MAKYYLLDLERTIAYEKPFYWKGNKHGYTRSLEQAGLFPKEIAQQIVDHDDIDRTTVMISQTQMVRILGKEIKPHEGIIKISE